MDMLEEIILPASDRTVLYMYCWRAENPRAVVLLAHGMTEHSMRYDRLGRFLAQQGISLYCHDQRGHGKTAAGRLGYLRKGLDWNMMINDLFTIRKKAIGEEVDCPIFLMGHSMGSFLVRRTVQLRPSMFDGLILSGTGDGQGAAGRLALQIVTAACLFMGQEHYSQKIKKMLFGGFNRGIANPQSEFDWLTRDREAVNSYLEDDWCGFLCSNGFYHELLQGIQPANAPYNIAGMRKDMPVYLFSGDCDPVGNMGKGVQHVRNLFLDAGLQDVTMELYAGGRHEMLNELNHDIVMDDLLQWLNHKIDAMQ